LLRGFIDIHSIFILGGLGTRLLWNGLAIRFFFVFLFNLLVIARFGISQFCGKELNEAM
jgi:hypothetical protein